MAKIPAYPYLGLTDAPAYGQEPGWLRDCVNMRPTPEGYLEMRGGKQRLMPSGGTFVAPPGTGYYFGGFDNTTPWGWVRVQSKNGSVVSSGWVQETVRGNAAVGANFIFPFWGDVTHLGVGTRFFVGSDQPFSTVTIRLSQAANWAGVTLAYKYGTADSATPTYSALTTTATFDFTTAVTANSGGRVTTAAWQMPSNWVPTTLGDGTVGRVRKYFMCVEITAFGALTDPPIIQYEPVRADWAGGHELYLAYGDPSTGTQNGQLVRFTQNVTAGDWFGVETAGFSGNGPSWRHASFRGILYGVNGREQKRFDEARRVDIGLPKPAITFTPTVQATGGPTWNGLGANLYFAYSFTYGYGPPQVATPFERSNRGGAGTAGTYNWTSTYVPTLYGESPPGDQSAIAYAAGTSYIVVADGSAIVWAFPTVAIPVNVGAIYVYRTENLAGSPLVAAEYQPRLFLGTILLRDAAGWVGGTPGSGFQGYVDQYITFPFPSKQLDRTDTAPPTNCKLVWVHNNRLWLASSDSYQARVWWSFPYEPDRFKTGIGGYWEDFSSARGARVTGGTSFGNVSVVFTEDDMWGVADVDGVSFQRIPIASAVGCVAPDACVQGAGLLVWPARDGFYAWDGEGVPQRVSKKMDFTFTKMSYERHGRSRATIFNEQYEVTFVSLQGIVGDTYRLDLRTGRWYRVTHGVAGAWVTLVSATMPVGTDDSGVRHPIMGQVGTGATNLNVLAGEFTTQDDGTNFTCVVDVAFGPWGDKFFSLDKAAFYYQAADGWGTPAITSINAAGVGYVPPASTVSSGSPDTGTNISLVQAGYSHTTSGGQDYVVRFQVSSAAGGTLRGQRLYAAVLVGGDSEGGRP